MEDAGGRVKSRRSKVESHWFKVEGEKKGEGGKKKDGNEKKGDGERTLKNGGYL